MPSPRSRSGDFTAPPILPPDMPSQALANNVFYIFSDGNPKSRLAMWGVNAQDVGVRVDGKLLPDQKWVLKPSADAPGYFIIENAYRTGHCIVVWGDGGLDVGVRPVSEASASIGHLWKVSEESDGTYFLSSKRTPNARLAAGRKLINSEGRVHEEQKWRLLQWTPGPHFVAQKVDNKIICDRFETFEAAKAAYDLGLTGNQALTSAKCFVSQVDSRVREKYGQSPDVGLSVKVAQREAALTSLSGPLWAWGPLLVAHRVENKAVYSRYQTFEAATEAYQELENQYAESLVTQAGGGVNKKYYRSPDIEMNVKVALEEGKNAATSGLKWASGPHIVAHNFEGKIACDWYPTFESAQTAFIQALDLRYSQCIVTVAGRGVVEKYGSSPWIEKCIKRAKEAAEEEEDAEARKAKYEIAAKIQEEEYATSDVKIAKLKASHATAAVETASAAAEAATEVANTIAKEEADAREAAGLEAIALKDAENLANRAEIEARQAAEAAAEIEAALAADRDYQRKTESLALAWKQRKEWKIQAQVTALDAKRAVKVEAQAKTVWNERAFALESANAVVAEKRKDAMDAAIAEETALRLRQAAEKHLKGTKDEREMSMLFRQSSQSHNFVTLGRARFTVRRFRFTLAIIFGALLGSWRVSMVVALLVYIVVVLFTPAFAAELLFGFDSSEIETAWGLQDGKPLTFQVFTLVYILLHGIGGDNDILVHQDELIQ